MLSWTPSDLPGSCLRQPIYFSGLNSSLQQLSFSPKRAKIGACRFLPNTWAVMNKKTSDAKAAEKQDTSTKAQMQKRKIVKEDGRTLIFYSFTDAIGKKQENK
jgi:hypothetical protein